MLLYSTLLLAVTCGGLLWLLLKQAKAKGQEVERRRQAEQKLIELKDDVSRLRKTLEAEDRERARLDAGGLLADDGYKRD